MTASSSLTPMPKAYDPKPNTCVLIWLVFIMVVVLLTARR